MSILPIGGISAYLGSGGAAAVEDASSAFGSFGPSAIVDFSGLASVERPGTNAPGAILHATYSAVTVLPEKAVNRQNLERDRTNLAYTTAMFEREYGKARSIADKLLKRDPNDAAAAHMVARTYQAEGNSREAIKYFSRATQLAPGSERFAQDFENAQILSGKEAAAVRTADRMLRNPLKAAQGVRLVSDLAERTQSADTLLSVGDLLFKNGMKQQALGEYRRALSMASGSKLDAVSERANAMLEDSPSAALAWQFRAEVDSKREDYDGAIRAYERAQILSRSASAYQRELADVLNRRGLERQGKNRLIEARIDFERAAALDITRADIQHNLDAIDL